VTNFDDLLSAKKAEFAEPIVDRHISAMGWIPYRPARKDVAHPIDRIWADLNKHTMLIDDTKAKARREFYPDTGMDMESFLGYHFLCLRYGFECFFSFVDEKEGRIYGGTLSKLLRRRKVQTDKGRLWYPRVENNDHAWIIYFPIIAMGVIGNLTNDECKELTRLSQRNEQYDLEPKFAW
jgi:hypothetical protein